MAEQAELVLNCIINAAIAQELYEHSLGSSRRAFDAAEMQLVSTNPSDDSERARIKADFAAIFYHILTTNNVPSVRLDQTPLDQESAIPVGPQASLLVPVVRRDAAAPLFTGYESEATDLEPRQEQTIPSAEYEMAVALQSQHGAERQGKASTILRPRVKDGQREPQQRDIGSIVSEGVPENFNQHEGEWRVRIKEAYPSPSASDMSSPSLPSASTSASPPEGIVKLRDGTCSRCGKLVKGDSFNFKRHAKAHLEQRDHKCPICYKECTRSDNLASHIENTHTRGRRCAGCGSTFTRPRMRTHLLSADSKQCLDAERHRYRKEYPY